MRRPRFAAATLGAGLILVLGLLTLWALRFRLATTLVDRKLAAAHVPASYRLTRIGPFLERMEDVRIGNPAAPDLVARRIDVSIGYGASGPILRAVKAEGVRLRAHVDAQGFSLGVLDRLLPKSAGGPAKLPNLMLRLHETQLLLSTPAGAMTIALSGEGNPARNFQGKADISAPLLQLASCTIRGIGAKLKVKVEGREPAAAGTVGIGAIRCPGLSLRSGVVRMNGSSDPGFERLGLTADLDGFGGTAGPARFAGLQGRIQAGGSPQDVSADASIDLAALALPDAAAAARRTRGVAIGSPVGPTVARAAGAVSRLLSRADAHAELSLSRRSGKLGVGLKRISLKDAEGEQLTATAHDGISWSADGLRVDADLETGGGDLPNVTARLRQSAAGAPMMGEARLAPYRAGAASLAAPATRLTWDGETARFDSMLHIDGPMGSGFVQGLDLPVRGYATSAGTFVIGTGCETVDFDQLRIGSFVFDPTRLSLCGQPIVERTASGTVRFAASSGAIRLTGRTTAGVPLVLGASGLQLSRQGFAGQAIEARLGDGPQPTRLAIGTIRGTMSRQGISGAFAEASGRIGTVPLDLTKAEGRWGFEDGVLRVDGRLVVSDVAPAPRFNPLVAEDAVLRLKDGVIVATAALREPATHAEIAKADLSHDLSAGTGHATLDVPGITFMPKGLQPEKLTPLTLGVIANVAGTVSGNGRIDWGPNGVTSSGTFGTERIDLAAAFGTVTGIRGQIHFTDLLGLVSAPAQEATIAEINPGIAVANGVVHYQLTGQNHVQIGDAIWPFAGGTLRLEPTLLDFGAEAERHLTFQLDGLNAAAFVQQLDFPNIAATGTFDGVLPMIFDHEGGRIEGGSIRARPGGGTLAYVGRLTNAELGTMGKLAFDALKAIRYSNLDISLDGRLDGEMISRVRFTGIRQATPEQGIIARMIRNLPFRFNIEIRAPFRGLVGSARAYIDPRLLLTPDQIKAATSAEPAVQSPASGAMR